MRVPREASACICSRHREQSVIVVNRIPVYRWRYRADRSEVSRHIQDYLVPIFKDPAERNGMQSVYLLSVGIFL